MTLLNRPSILYHDEKDCTRPYNKGYCYPKITGTYNHDIKKRNLSHPEISCVFIHKGAAAAASSQQALKLISRPFTECVKAPTEIKSTPHSA